MYMNVVSLAIDNKLYYLWPSIAVTALLGYHLPAINHCDKVPVITRLQLVVLAGKSYVHVASSRTLILQTRRNLTCDH